jgi:3-isopropylmalate dehydrogenase
MPLVNSRTITKSVCLTRSSFKERIAKVAFELARTRSKKVTSVDKENVLASSKLWNLKYHQRDFQ